MNRSPYLEDHPALAAAVYGDAREQADLAAGTCPFCDAPVRWVRNTGGRWDDSLLQIAARPLLKPAWFEAQEHAGLVAVFTDGSAFAVSRFTRWSQVRDAWLYRCHWDECDGARAECDRRHQRRMVLRARVFDEP